VEQHLHLHHRPQFSSEKVLCPLTPRPGLFAPARITKHPISDPFIGLTNRPPPFGLQCPSSVTPNRHVGPIFSRCVLQFPCSSPTLVFTLFFQYPMPRDVVAPRCIWCTPPFWLCFLGTLFFVGDSVWTPWTNQDCHSPPLPEPC